MEAIILVRSMIRARTGKQLSVIAIPLWHSKSGTEFRGEVSWIARFKLVFQPIANLYFWQARYLNLSGYHRIKWATATTSKDFCSSSVTWCQGKNSDGSMIAHKVIGMNLVPHHPQSIFPAHIFRKNAANAANLLASLLHHLRLMKHQTARKKYQRSQGRPTNVPITRNALPGNAMVANVPYVLAIKFLRTVWEIAQGVLLNRIKLTWSATYHEWIGLSIFIVCASSLEMEATLPCLHSTLCGSVQLVPSV